jgi:surface protein
MCYCLYYFSYREYELELDVFTMTLKFTYRWDNVWLQTGVQGFVSLVQKAQKQEWLSRSAIFPLSISFHFLFCSVHDKAYPSKTSTAMSTAASTDTETNKKMDTPDDVEVGSSPSVSSYVADRRDGLSIVGEVQSKCSTSLTTVQTEDDDSDSDSQESNISAVCVTVSPRYSPPIQCYSRPGAYHVMGKKSESFLSETAPVPSAPTYATTQSRGYIRGEHLSEAKLVVETDLVFGEPVVGVEEPKGFWRKRKLHCLTVIQFLVIIGVAVGITVGVQHRGGGSTTADLTTSTHSSDPPTPAPIFDCSNSAVGCLYTGQESFNFPDPDSVLIANCMDTDFTTPTSDNCQCEVSVPSSTFGNPERCRSCEFVNCASGAWRLAYDCSNLFSGVCVGRNTSNSCISRVPFETTEELRIATDIYLSEDSTTDSAVALKHGWPIGIWDVSQIQDFSYLFSSSHDSTSAPRSNPCAMNFDEDLSGWDVSNATTMVSMFDGAETFNHPIGNWNVSKVPTMRFMFGHAMLFNQSLADWDVSSVRDMSYMFSSAKSFDQPLGDWDVSSVTDMQFMFLMADSFNQPLHDWNVSSVEDMSAMFFLASRFCQPLGSWGVANETNAKEMFESSECPFEGELQSCFYH